MSNEAMAALHFLFIFLLVYYPGYRELTSRAS